VILTGVFVLRKVDALALKRTMRNAKFLQGVVGGVIHRLLCLLAHWFLSVSVGYGEEWTLVVPSVKVLAVIMEIVIIALVIIGVIVTVIP